MMYVVKHTLLAFTLDQVDYICKQGDSIELPDHEHVNNLEVKGFIEKLKNKKKNE